MLKGVSLTFDTRYLYDYDAEKQHLSIKPNPAGAIPELMNDHFGVIALVGQNGAGKSTLMARLMSLLGDGTGEVDGDMLFLLEQEIQNVESVAKKYELVAYSGNSIGLEIPSELKERMGEPRTEKVTREGVHEWRRPLVYLSNHLDVTHFDAPSPLFRELGKNLILNPLNDLLRSSSRIHPNLQDGEQVVTPIFPALLRYQRIEFNRMTEWLVDDRFSSCLDGAELKLPNAISFWDNYYERRAEVWQDLETAIIPARINATFSAQTPIADLVGWLLLSLLVYMQDDCKRAGTMSERYFDEMQSYRTALIDLLKENSTSRVEFKGMMSMVLGLLESGKVSWFKDNLMALIDLITKLDGLDKESRVFTDTGRNTFQLWFKTKEDHAAARMIKDTFRKIFPHAEVVTSKLIHKGVSDHLLSSGEMSLLALVGKLREAMVKIEGDFILLLDEFELTLHPKWQQMVTSIITKVMGFDWRKKERSIQVIVATHSPLILSDFPGESVYRMDDGRIVQQVGSRTFAMPLYELLHDEFFLEQSFIGALAKQEIADIVKTLDSHFWGHARELLNFDGADSVVNYLEPIVKRIERIGDDFVGNSLMDRFYSKLPTEVRKALEVEKLKERIQRLEKGEGQ